MTETAGNRMITMNRPVNYFKLLGASAVLLLSAQALAEQASYTTPEEAAQALINAAADSDMEALRTVLGPEADELSSGDPVADAADREAFIEAAVTAAGIEQEEGGDNIATLVIGEDDWPFAIPLVKENDQWRFDMEAGLEELYARRIGRNELHTIAVLQEIVDAQREYYAIDRDGDGINEYTLRLASSEGKQNGLYWPVEDGQEPSPMGPLISEAMAQGYEKSKDGEPVPFHGYYYRVLDEQGPHASGGAMQYMQDGNAIRGFAVLAYPAEYGNSGIMSFIVNQDGIVFEKDLGEETGKLVQSLKAYDPDASWEPVTD
jgi:hypothetical protein